MKNRGKPPLILPSKRRRRQRLARYSPHALIAMLLVGGGAPIAQPLGFQWPAIVQPASTEHHAGKIVWADLITPDLDGARRFYGELFGWTFHDAAANEADYTVAYVGRQPVAGLVHRAMPAGEKRQPAWLTFIAVRDVDATRRLALAHGAKILAEPRNYPNRGTQAVFADPQGAVFAVLASSAGDPPDVLPAPGKWIWSSLITRDADTDAAFYQTVIGYDVFETPGAQGAQHLVLSSDDFARASANPFPANAEHHRAHWLDFIRVANVADTAAKAGALGGRVLVEPRTDRHGGRIAVLEDPAGARFGVMEWVNGATAQGAK
jgi:predicted enzyme related to lactoylglutathione lyase